DAHDYRYFPDPDLPPLVLSEEWIERVRGELPELPHMKQERYQRELGLSAYDAQTLTQSREMAAYFEDVVARLGGAEGGAAKTAANWVMVELSGALNRSGLAIEQAPVTSAQLARLIARIRDNTISGKIAKELFDAIWQGEATGEDAVDTLIERKGLKQISDVGALTAIVEEVIAANPKSVDEYRGGKEKALNALVGQAMKATKGKANPAQLAELFRNKLAS
ncbi:MAG: Asp-tRNA(Asn)/Glu-tRNA(Gln) amidotransferase GatCAB subunit B, partial [Pseudomonadota bacterium]